MKKPMFYLVQAAILITLASVTYAQSESVGFDYAEVDYPAVVRIGAGSPEMVVRLVRVPLEDYRLTQSVAAESEYSLSAMNFTSWGLLQANPDLPEQWISKDQYIALVQAAGYGTPYKITSTCTGEFSNGFDRLPGGSFACIPTHIGKDAQKEFSLGAKIGEPGPALGQITPVTTRIIYQSDPLGLPSAISIRYGFLPYNSDGSAPYSKDLYLPIPAGQPPGTYAGVTVTIDIAAAGT
jgi:hypothetical protein